MSKAFINGIAPQMDNVRFLIETFTNHLTTILDRQAQERARDAVESAFGSGKRGPGRPPKIASIAVTGSAFGSGKRGPGRPPKIASIAVARKARRKGPKQLCPVPGCKNAAAPVFGMVCSKHKDLPKAKIKEYREARRAKKLKAA